MPLLWKIGMLVLIVCLVASMAIAVIRLTTTPTEVLGDGFRGLPAHHGDDGRSHSGDDGRYRGGDDVRSQHGQNAR
jgi:hypothetical protein